MRLAAQGLTAPDAPAGPHRRGIALDAAMITAAVFVALYFPDRDDTSGAIIGTIAALPAAALGVAATRHSRPLPRRSLTTSARYAVGALLVGVAAGTVNLLVNYGLTKLDPRVLAMTLRKLAVSSHWSMMVSAPVTEELTFRLVALGGTAWLLGRYMKNRERIFPIALIVSAILFGLLHPPYPIPFSEPILLVHATAVLVKASAVGLMLGWIFWRWGLPYSMMCHGAANGIYILLAPLLY